VTILMFPPVDDEPWPTLGPDVCAFIEENWCHGPGDLLGQTVDLDDEVRAWLYRIYEVEPPYFVHRKNKTIVKRKNPRAGMRRFERCVLSLRKGSNKTEIAAWIAGTELHPDGPVRCAGFTTVRGEPRPIGRGVVDPYIPMIAYTEEQVEDLAYKALLTIVEHSRLAGDFDIGLERIVRADGSGKAEAVSGSPSARDGARTTFQHADETHRFTLEHLRNAWKVMMANLAKRPLADPWALETTTAPEPGTDSVAEKTFDHARKVMARPELAEKSKLFFFHREASGQHDLDSDAGLKAAVVEASGPYIGKWTDPDRIVSMFHQPDADRAYLERVYLNRPVQAALKAFDVERWKQLAKPNLVIPAGDTIALGFDGGRYDDPTALVGTHLVTGFQWPVGFWEKPASWPDEKPWKVDEEAVDQAVHAAFERWHVVRMYCDPFKWETYVSAWAGRYSDKRVFLWETNRRKPMAYAIRAYRTSIEAGELSHNGDEVFTQHIGNCCRLNTGLVDEEEKPLWILRKERPDSPNKIDLPMAGILSWEARNDAIADGAQTAGAWRWKPIHKKQQEQ
jgi:phage terminase large subunit-like protein